MKNNILRLGLFAGLCTALSAQTPLLGIRNNPDKTSRQAFVLANSYVAPATEWVLEINDGGNHVVMRHGWGLPATSAFYPVTPGESLPFGAPANSKISDVAVVYADGATAGDPATVAAILRARQMMLDDLRAVIPMLDAAAKPGADYAALQTSLQQRLADHRAAVINAWHADGNAGPPPGTADRISQPLVADLGAKLAASAPSSDFAAYCQRKAAFLRGWVGQLEASQPALH